MGSGKKRGLGFMTGLGFIGFGVPLKRGLGFRVFCGFLGSFKREV